jgi:hypothetical protein
VDIGSLDGLGRRGMQLCDQGDSAVGLTKEAPALRASIKPSSLARVARDAPVAAVGSPVARSGRAISAWNPKDTFRLRRNESGSGCRRLDESHDSDRIRHAMFAKKPFSSATKS